MSLKIKIVSLIFLILFALVIVRLFTWQIIKGDELSNQARSQYTVDKSVSAPRGNILALDGSLLSARRQSWLLYIQIPDTKKSPEDIADKLAPLLVEDSGDKGLVYDEAGRIKQLLSNKGSVWIPIKHKVSSEVKINIESLKIAGIGFEGEEDRYYPEASSAAHLLGFVGKNTEGEDTGYFGLEGYYNVPLSGKSGFYSGEKDAKGVPILLGNYRETSAIEGVNLVTNVDKTVQLILEKKLLDGIEKYGAKGGTAIIANPKTGAILGMSSYPSFEPQSYFNYGDSYFKNPAISDTFEPGSVFKILVMAAALDTGVVEPDTKCDICGGPLYVDKYTIETWNNKYFPESTMTDVIVHSDNVGMTFVGQKIGAERLYEYLDKFGIGKQTGIDLQGEVAAPLREKNSWNIVDLATASFGQGVAVTPIEMLKAASAIANKGKAFTPQVVNKLNGNGWEETIKPKYEQVISEDTANKITAMMVEAAKSGESKWTNILGFKVAGKTGTAQIPIKGHYDAEKTIASFIGFAPADDPKFIMLVTLKEPITSPWASETAAPLWYSIARELFSYLKIQPEN